MRCTGRFIENVLTNKVSGTFAGYLVFITLILVLAEVISRYFFNNPIGLSDEFGGYLLVGITMIGLAYTLKEKGHVRVEMVVDRVSLKTRKWMRVISLSLATVFTPFLIFGSYELVAFSHRLGAKSSTWVRTLQEIPQSILIIGTILLFLQLIVMLVQAIKNLSVPEGEAQ